jgi:hypothetical protein
MGSSGFAMGARRASMGAVVAPMGAIGNDGYLRAATGPNGVAMGLRGCDGSAGAARGPAGCDGDAHFCDEVYASFNLLQRWGPSQQCCDEVNKFVGFAMCQRGGDASYQAAMGHSIRDLKDGQRGCDGGQRGHDGGQRGCDGG